MCACRLEGATVIPIYSTEYSVSLVNPSLREAEPPLRSWSIFTWEQPQMGNRVPNPVKKLPVSEPMRLQEALGLVLPLVSAILEQEATPLDQAPRRVLATDVFATTDLPSGDSSAVDGFAAKSSDLDG